MCFSKSVSRPSKILHQQNLHSHSSMDALDNLSVRSTCNMLLFLSHPFIVFHSTYSVQVFTFIMSVFGFCCNLFHPASLFTVTLPMPFHDSQICHFIPHYLFGHFASPCTGSMYQSTPPPPQEMMLFSAFSPDSFPSVTYQQKGRTLQIEEEQLNNTTIQSCITE